MYESYTRYFSKLGHQEIRALEESFEIELERVSKSLTIYKVLEIGFGYGNFLEFCKSKGFDAVGVEIVPEFVEYAREKGFSVYQGQYKKIPELNDQKFDLICLFDVLEHFNLEEINSFFTWARERLNKNGKILVKTPNCGSPFGMVLQNGDPTHITNITEDFLSSIGKCHGFRSKTFNSARPIKSGRYPKLILLCLGIFKDLIEIIVGKIYLGKRMKLDPNITTIIELDHL